MRKPGLSVVQDLIFVKHVPTFLQKNVVIPSPRAREFEKLLESEEFADLILVVGKVRGQACLVSLGPISMQAAITGPGRLVLAEAVGLPSA